MVDRFTILGIQVCLSSLRNMASARAVLDGNLRKIAKVLIFGSFN
jgi:hypothetical protein